MCSVDGRDRSFVEGQRSDVPLVLLADGRDALPSLQALERDWKSLHPLERERGFYVQVLERQTASSDDMYRKAFLFGRC